MSDINILLPTITLAVGVGLGYGFRGLIAREERAELAKLNADYSKLCFAIKAKVAKVKKEL